MSISYDDVKTQMQWVCAAMIPGDATLGMPSALDVDVPGTLLPQALKARDDLAGKFLQIAARFPAQPPANPLAFISATPAADMEILGRFVAGAYFSSKKVATALRFPGFEALIENVDYDEIMQAVEPIIERGPCYVPC